VSSAQCSYGSNLRLLVVYLLVYQYVPVGRCVELIDDLTGGAGPSSGFVHSMLAGARSRCAQPSR
jgi:transposase